MPNGTANLSKFANLRRPDRPAPTRMMSSALQLRALNAKVRSTHIAPNRRTRSFWPTGSRCRECASVAQRSRIVAQSGVSNHAYRHSPRPASAREPYASVRSAQREPFDDFVKSGRRLHGRLRAPCKIAVFWTTSAGSNLTGEIQTQVPCNNVTPISRLAVALPGRAQWTFIGSAADCRQRATAPEARRTDARGNIKSAASESGGHLQKRRGEKSLISWLASLPQISCAIISPDFGAIIKP